MRLKLGEMYIDYISIEGYNEKEILIKFTNIIDNAELYSEDKIVLYKRLIESCLQCSLTEEIVEDEEKEN